MSTSKTQPPATHPDPAHPAPATAAQHTDDVLIDTPETSITIGGDDTVESATARAELVPGVSLKDGFLWAATTLANHMEGGSPCPPKDPTAFWIALENMGKGLSLFVGFDDFMTRAKSPRHAHLVPGAAAAVTENWALLLRLVPEALDDTNITTITALLAHLKFVWSLLSHVGGLTNRLIAVENDVEIQLATQLRPLYDRCQALFVSHDDLVGPMRSVVQLFSVSGNVPPGTVAQPVTVVPPLTVAQPVKAPASPPAPRKGHPRG